MAKTETRKAAPADRGLAPVVPGPGSVLAPRDADRDSTQAVDVCAPALLALANLRDELNQIGSTVKSWPGGLPPVVAESLRSAADGVGVAFRGVSAADAAIKSAEFGR